jgi:hypothetical protein
MTARATDRSQKPRERYRSRVHPHPPRCRPVIVLFRFVINLRLIILLGNLGLKIGIAVLRGAKRVT